MDLTVASQPKYSSKEEMASGIGAKKPFISVGYLYGFVQIRIDVSANICECVCASICLCGCVCVGVSVWCEIRFFTY